MTKSALSDFRKVCTSLCANLEIFSNLENVKDEIVHLSKEMMSLKIPRSMISKMLRAVSAIGIYNIIDSQHGFRSPYDPV